MLDETRTKVENPETHRKRSITMPISQHDKKPRKPLKRLTLDDSPIQLRSSKLSDYTKISMLGKGTYGEVHKCIHKPTGLIVAMKTYMFEVSLKSAYLCFRTLAMV
jgi:serine/threonine protein kinase